MIRPTRRAVTLFAIMLPVPWLMLVYTQIDWVLCFNVSAFLLLAMAVDAALLYPRHRVTFELTAPRTGFVGEPLEVSIAVGTGRRARPPEFETALDLEGNTRAAFPSEPAIVRDTGPHRLQVTPERRGVLTIARAWLRWRGPFKLMQRVHIVELERAIPILPNVRSARSTAFMLFARDALFGLKAQREKGEGSEFEALREYAPGFDIRHIDWKHSARHRKLLTKEFRAERNHPVILAFDTGHLMREPLDHMARLDHSINAGLLFAWLALRGGDLVGLTGFDSRIRCYLTPTRGVRSFRHLQQASAGLAYSDEETNFTLGLSELQLRLSRRALVILFTDFVDTITAEILIENVTRLTRHHLVVFVTIRDTGLAVTADAAPDALGPLTRAVIAHDLIRERRVVLERLSRLGVHCLDVPPSGLSIALVNKYVDIKQRDLL